MNAVFRAKLIKFSILFTLSLTIYLTGMSSQLVRHVYSEGIYNITSVAQRLVSSLIPFPIGDFLYLLLIAYVFRRLWRFIQKIRHKSLKTTERITAPIQAINFLLVLYLIFKLSWGLNYSRPSITTQLGIANEKYTTPQLLALGKFFIGKLNKLQTVKKKRFTITELQSNAKAGYDYLAVTNPFFNYTKPVVKPVLNSWIITKIGIEGYYNPLSGEANVNMRLPAVALPFVTCHEIAHQLGIAREDEANLVGYLVAINSADPYFQYSAAYAMLKSILFEIRLKSPEDYEALHQTINPLTLQDFKEDKAFWKKYNNQMFSYLDIAFDRFLKLNNQRKGTDSYQDIVLWLYNIHKKDL